MIFKKTFFSIVVLLLIAPLAQAESRDYLLVEYEYSWFTKSFKFLSAEQRVLDDPGQLIGDYDMDLVENGQIISNAKFNLRSRSTVEALGGESVGFGQPDIYDATLPLALSGDIDANNTSVQIKNNGQVIVELKLSDLKVDIISAKSSKITISKQISYPTLPKLDENNNRPFLDIGITILVLLGILAGVFIFLRKKRQLPPPPAPLSNQPSTPPTIPPTPPTT